MSCERQILAFLGGVKSGAKAVLFIVIGVVLVFALFMTIGKTAFFVLAVVYLFWIAIGFAMGIDTKNKK